MRVALVMLVFSACTSLGGAFGDMAGEGAEKVIKQATRPAIREVLLALNEPRNRALLADLLSDPAIASAAREVSAAAVGGAVDAFLDPDRQARLREATDLFMQTLGKIELGPMARGLASDFIVGVDDGLARIAAESERGQRGATMLTRVEQVSEGLPLALWLALGGLALVSVGLIVWVVLLMRRLARLTAPPRTQ